MSDDVKRYSFTPRGMAAPVSEGGAGKWVAWEDYERLRARIEELERELLHALNANESQMEVGVMAAIKRYSERNGVVTRTGHDGRCGECQELKTKLDHAQVLLTTCSSALRAISEMNVVDFKAEGRYSVERIDYVRAIEWVQALANGVLGLVDD